MIYALVDATGGAVGAMIGSAVQWCFPKIGKPFQLKWPITLFTFVGLAISRPIAADIVKTEAIEQAPETVDSALREIEMKVPLYAVLRKQDPKLYKQFRDKMVEDIRLQKTQSDLEVDLQQITSKLYQERLPFVSDETMTDAIRLTIDKALIVLSINPQDCVNLISGKSANIAPYLDNELRNRDYDLSKRILLEKPISNSRLLNEKETQTAIFPILTDMSKRSGQSLQNIAALLQSNGQPAEQCKTAINLYEGILKLPEDRRAILIRTMLNAR